jgi:putative transposase
MSTHHGILIHAVFSTKHRFRCLAESWREELFSYMGGTAKEHDAILLSAGGIEDHIHLLLKIHPKFAISATIQMIKANSSRWINETGRIAGKFSWQRGYGAFSVSESMSDRVKNYIGNQREHHRNKTFEEEYLAFLRRHHVSFDPRFVFDDEIIA